MKIVGQQDQAAPPLRCVTWNVVQAIHRLGALS